MDELKIEANACLMIYALTNKKVRTLLILIFLYEMIIEDKIYKSNLYIHKFKNKNL